MSCECPVLNNMVLLSVQKDRYRTKQAFNAHNDKTRDNQEGATFAYAHDITKNHKREEHESIKMIPGNPEEAQLGTTDDRDSDVDMEKIIQKVWGHNAVLLLVCLPQDPTF